MADSERAGAYAPVRFLMKALKAIALLIVACAGVSLLFTARKGVEGNLLALAGASSGGAELNSAASAMAESARFIVKSESVESARLRLRSLGVPVADVDLSIALKALAPYARGFLSSAVREQLERGDFAAVRDAAAARLYSPMPPVVSPDRDPFLLFTDYVLSSVASNGDWVVVNAQLTAEQARDALVAVKGADDVRCAGAPFHTAVASERSRREINALSVVSLFCVVLFGWLLTRSFRFLPVLVAMLAAAFCVAAAALFAAFDKPHLLTFVFGTTLIGLSVDYVYHALTARESIAKPLSFSFLSTAICFLPLLFSKVGVMNQMALFTIAGLATVYAGVMVFMQGGRSMAYARNANDGADALCGEMKTCRGVDAWPVGARIGIVMVLAMLPAGLALIGMSCGRIQIPKSVDISRFYRPDPYLAEGEKLAVSVAGGAGFIPTAAEQRHNANLVRRLYLAEGENYCRMTGLPTSVIKLPPRTDEKVFDPKGELEALLDGWHSEICGWLAVSLLVLVCALAMIFRRKSFGFVVPLAATYIATDGMLLLLGEWRNFFTEICMFIFIGLGFDYSIFRWHANCRGSSSTEKAVRYSFLTSLVGFGSLAFTDFAVTRSMGLTLAFGLSFSYFAAKMCSGSSCVSRQAALTAWHEQEEQCASRFWMQFMWYSYAWFGKNFQKLIFVVGMLFIYMFAKPPRIALRKFYAVISDYTGKPFDASHGRMFRHLLGFAWGLMDKTDACTLKKDLPKMTVRDDSGWREFNALVDSGKGAFLLCTHVGMIGVLPALPCTLEARRIPKVHAFQQMGHDAVFMKVFMKHFDHSMLELHAVENIGVETAVEMQSAIGRGELVIMAGDRTSAGSKSVFRHEFLGRDCVWPKGAFKFAQLMEAPVFAVTCICTGWNRYEVHLAALHAESILADYVRFLESETLVHPDQWYQFYDFFAAGQR